MSHPQTSDPARPDPPGQSLLAPLPGSFRQVPVPPAAETNPDPPGPAADGDSGPGSSGGPEAPTRTDGPFGRLTRARTAPYEAIARGALRALGGLLNSRLQADDDDESFLPDADDEKNVPPPVGRLMARRIPFDVTDSNLSDVEDMAAAAVGLLAWGVKGVTSAWENRRRVRRERHGAAVHDDAGQEQDQP